MTGFRKISQTPDTGQGLQQIPKSVQKGRTSFLLIQEYPVPESVSGKKIFFPVERIDPIQQIFQRFKIGAVFECTIEI